MGLLEASLGSATWVRSRSADESEGGGVSGARSTSRTGGLEFSRLDHSTPSLLGEVIANATAPSPVMEDTGSSSSYHWPLDTAPNVASGAPSISGRVLHVLVSVQDVLDIDESVPPVLEASVWNKRSRTAVTSRSCRSDSVNRRNDCRTG